MIQDNAPGAELTDRVHIVADIENGTTLIDGSIAHLAKALLLEFHITHRENLVHDEDLTVQVGGYSKGQLDVHTAGIALDGSVDKALHLCEFHNLVKFAVNLGLGHAKDGPVHIDVFPTSQLRVETGAYLQHRGDPTVIANNAFCGGGHPGQQL